MSDRNIVLILGAGASVPYGFPVGHELVHDICANLESRIQGLQPHSHGQTGPVQDAMRAQLAHDAKQFCAALEASGRMSIDQFLEHHPSLWHIGRIAIALSLLPAETSSNLSNVRGQEDNWYQHLFNWLAPGRAEDFPAHNIGVITYNYDSSLEEYLHRAVMNAYEDVTGPQMAAQLVAKIPIVHIHGSFGRLPWQEGDGEAIPYDGDAVLRDRDKIISAAENIKIIFDENVEKSEALNKAYNLLRDAHVVLFFGFGFHELNVKRLKLGASCRSEVYLAGTIFGCTDAEQAVVLDRLKRHHARCSEHHIKLKKCKTLDFIRDTQWLQLR